MNDLAIVFYGYKPASLNYRTPALHDQQVGAARLARLARLVLAHLRWCLVCSFVAIATALLMETSAESHLLDMSGSDTGVWLAAR